MCKFCEAMESHRRVDTILNKNDPDWSQRYSVAIVARSFLKGRKGSQSTSTDYRYRGCGYALNFCPECGRQLTRKVNRHKPKEKEAAINGDPKD